jgi:hypothetical protein
MPKVVFPDPDSPTIPNVCPSKTFMFTLLTAFIKPVVLFKKPFFIGYHTFNSFVDNKGFLLLILTGFPFGSEARSFLV